ncbi:MAG: Co2+/Mg2+ efflux protein ApaG [Gemmatimonadota bacterium]|jgi:ApaG protein
MTQYVQETEGILVRVQPSFSLARSALDEGRYVFSYRVELENNGPESGQLLFRHWYIHDSAGEDTEVEGEGVVGEQPCILPGDQHRYESFCVLSTPVGSMRGHYTFERSDGRRFVVDIPEFRLQGPHTPVDLGASGPASRELMH